MEQLLHYVWKHKMLPLEPLATSNGQQVEVVDPGLHNRNAGPDFFNAKVKIDGALWVGNVEIHDRASDWYAHGHDRDAAYDNVVLHVCGEIDTPVCNSQGRLLPQLRLEVPGHVAAHYAELITADKYPPCYRIIPSLSKLVVHSWMSALQTERLERKTVDIDRRLRQVNGDWEAAYFATMARACGFSLNGDAFEQWALSMPLHAVDHHRDDLFQVEAFFLGQAGLLDPASVPERHREQALADDYFLRLRSEYAFLKNKFSLTTMDPKRWKYLRLRPQNFPQIRIAQLANLHYERRTGLRSLVECVDVKALRQLYTTQVTPYWATHYGFGRESDRIDKRLTQKTVDVLILNAAIPMLFAYGRSQGEERLCDRAFDILEQLEAEDNSIVRMWSECGLEVSTAGDSQALIQLKKEYCDRHDCLRCRIGHQYLSLPLSAAERRGEYPADKEGKTFIINLNTTKDNG